MEINFDKDLRYSQEVKSILKDIYSQRAFEKRYVFIDKGEKYRSLGSEYIQKNLCVDTILQIDDNESILIEEKFRRVDYGDLLVETKSCSNIGYEKEGWIYTSQADYLVYVVDSKNVFKIYIINMNKLKDFFLKNKDKYISKRTQQINRTEFILIPFKDLDFKFNKTEIDKKCITTSQS